jgi:hypothetical protein
VLSAAFRRREVALSSCPGVATAWSASLPRQVVSLPEVRPLRARLSKARSESAASASRGCPEAAWLRQAAGLSDARRAAAAAARPELPARLSPPEVSAIAWAQEVLPSGEVACARAVPRSVAASV